MNSLIRFVEHPLPSIPIYAKAFLAVTLVILLVWEVGVRIGYFSALFFPAPSSVASHLLAQIVDGTLWPHVGATLIRLSSGFVLGGSTGLVVGLLMGWSVPIGNVLDPFVAVTHPLPKIALLPFIFAGAWIALNTALVITIAVELLSAKMGLGASFGWHGRHFAWNNYMRSCL